MTDFIQEYLNSRNRRQYGSNTTIQSGPDGNTLSMGTFPGDIFGSSYPQMDLNETPEEMGQRMSDAQQNTNFGNVVVGGARDAIQGAGETISELGNFVGLKIPPPRLPEVDKPEGTINNIARGFTQFGVGMLASPVKGFSLGKNIIRGAFSDSYFDPEEGGFVTFLREMGVGPEILEILDTRVGEDASVYERLKGRLGNAVEGAVLGGIVDTLQYIKQTPHLLQKARETIIQAGKNAEARMADGGATLMSGVDPDPLIAGAGRMLDNTRQQDELGFYSKALDEINKISLNQGSSQQWMKTLENAGVKKDEMYWTGLDEFFKRKGNQVITKGELIDYMNKNQVQLKEVRLGVDGDTGEGGSLQFSSDEGSYDFNIMEGEEIAYNEENIRYDLEEYVSGYSDAFDGTAYLSLKHELLKRIYDEGMSLSDNFDGFRTIGDVDNFVLNPQDPLQPQFSGMALPREYKLGDVIGAILQKKWEADGDFDNVDEWFANNKKDIEEATDIPVIILDKITPEVFSKAQLQFDEIIEKLAEEQYRNNPVFMESATTDHATYQIIGNDDIGYTIRRDGEALTGDRFNNLFDLNEARVQAQQEAVYREDVDIDYDFEEGSETAGQFDGPAQFANQDWRESGGSNYREILLTSPNIRDATKTNFEILQGDARTGQHHSGYKNIIAHLRLTDRTTSDGKKVLYIDEIQSDWSQKGKGNFKSSAEDISKIENTRSNLIKDHQNEINKYTILQDGKQIPFADWFFKEREKLKYSKQNEEVNSSLLNTAFEGELSAGNLYKDGNLVSGISSGKANKVLEINTKINEITGQLNRQSWLTDKGPFVEDTNKWTQMTMKRVLRMAIDEGYDAIAWTPGKVQTERCGSISSSIKKLDVYTVENLNVNVDENKPVFMIGNLVDENGDVVISDKPVSYKGLEKLFGKQGAFKIVDDLRTKFDADSDKYMEYENPNIRFIKQGMYEQYDKILPNNSNKIVRKLDKSAKVENIKIEFPGPDGLVFGENIEDRLGIFITDKMKESVKGGQPLFTGPAVVGASGAGAMMANQGAEDGNTN